MPPFDKEIKMVLDIKSVHNAFSDLFSLKTYIWTSLYEQVNQQSNQQDFSIVSSWEFLLQKLLFFNFFLNFESQDGLEEIEDIADEKYCVIDAGNSNYSIAETYREKASLFSLLSTEAQSLKCISDF